MLMRSLLKVSHSTLGCVLKQHHCDCFKSRTCFCLILIEGQLSPCRHMNGGCGDLCLLTPYGRVNCTCRGERVLLDDNRCVCKSSGLLCLHLRARCNPASARLFTLTDIFELRPRYITTHYQTAVLLQHVQRFSMSYCMLPCTIFEYQKSREEQVVFHV